MTHIRPKFGIGEPPRSTDKIQVAKLPVALAYLSMKCCSCPPSKPCVQASATEEAVTLSTLSCEGGSGLLVTLRRMVCRSRPSEFRAMQSYAP